MKYLPIVLILMACEPEFDIDTYIDESCVGDADRTMYMNRSCGQQWVLEEICDSVDYVNDELEIDIQVCGYIVDGERDRHTVKCDWSPPTAGKYYVGYKDKKQNIQLWPKRLIHFDWRYHLRKVIRHELGHYLGAGHSDDTRDVMATGWNGVTLFTEHDKEAMR